MTLGASGGAVQPLTRDELIELAQTTPVTTVAMTARAFGVSEPVIRAQIASRELEAIGVHVLRIGRQIRIPTADLLRVMGVDGTERVPGPALTVVRPGAERNPAA